MAISHKSSLLFSSCSLLMAALFAYSAAVQLDDPDWYFWLPLYALACAVNLHQSVRIFKRNKWVAGFTFCGAISLFLKVVYEAYEHSGFAEVLSLDMNEKLVREKLGSGLVLISMFFQYKAADVAESPVRVRREQIWRTIEYGTMVLVAMSFGLVVSFFVLVKEIKR